ncbi:hypothetical protein BDQ12DRAFT_671919 [Crucibulum laeve]|uniref:Uncharacterized protein n=1 Tax=Crucibulum laeve TaxID=68775 RepID=A0A5C3LE79_9AGAR|nr:hypothetical protein BDQ12DRAFT_671919 [Crucibulum laeve]
MSTPPTPTAVHHFTDDEEEPRITEFHANSTPFPTIKLGAEYKSKGYITRTVFMGGNIKFAIEDVVVQPVSSARNSKYGVEYITISLPNNFINHLIQSTGSKIRHPTTKAGSTWFNVQIVADFGGCSMGESEIKVPMDVFRPGDGVGLVTRMLFNAYTSHHEDGGPSYIRFRLHDAEIMAFVNVSLPFPVRGAKTPTRLSPRKRSNYKTLYQFFERPTIAGETEQDETNTIKEEIFHQRSSSYRFNRLSKLTETRVMPSKQAYQCFDGDAPPRAEQEIWDGRAGTDLKRRRKNRNFASGASRCYLKTHQIRPDIANGDDLPKTTMVNLARPSTLRVHKSSLASATALLVLPAWRLGPHSSPSSVILLGPCVVVASATTTPLHAPLLPDTLPDTSSAAKSNTNTTTTSQPDSSSRHSSFLGLEIRRSKRKSFNSRIEVLPVACPPIPEWALQQRAGVIDKLTRQQVTARKGRLQTANANLGVRKRDSLHVPEDSTTQVDAWVSCFHRRLVVRHRPPRLGGELLHLRPTTPRPSSPTFDGSWLTTNTHNTTPKFSRLGFSSSGVALPVSAREHKRVTKASSSASIRSSFTLSSSSKEQRPSSPTPTVSRSSTSPSQSRNPSSQSRAETSSRSHSSSSNSQRKADPRLLHSPDFSNVYLLDSFPTSNSASEEEKGHIKCFSINSRLARMKSLKSLRAKGAKSSGDMRKTAMPNKGSADLAMMPKPGFYTEEGVRKAASVGDLGRGYTPTYGASVSSAQAAHPYAMKSAGTEQKQKMDASSQQKKGYDEAAI